MKSEYVGRHRAPSRKIPRIPVILAATVAAVVGFQSAALAVDADVVRGDTFSELVATHCGTSNWQGISFPGRDKNLIYAGETISFDCEPTGDPVAQPAAPASAPVTIDNGWRNPLPGASSSNCNFWQWRGSYNHAGEDLSAGYGTPIYAAHAGQVSTSWDDGAGNMTVITHDGMAEVYMHQSSFAVTSGWVNAGDVIGYVGSTGNSSGPHLHFEVQPWGAWNGVTNPISWLQDRGVAISC